MTPSVFAKPPTAIYWYVPFEGSIHVRLHAQTPTPLRDTTFSMIIASQTGGIAYGVPPLNVTVNRQLFLVFRTDQCCYEGIGLFSNINITASMVFDVSIPSTPNGS